MKYKMKLVPFCIFSVCIIFSVIILGNTKALEDFSYNGPYVDIVSELARRKPAETGFNIVKVDSETGLACANIMEVFNQDGSLAGKYVQLQMPMEDGTYTLVFENDVLSGYFSPEATIEDRLQNKMESDYVKKSELLKAYKTYIAGFLENQNLQL